MVYLEDILVTGASEEEHQATLKEVICRLAESGLCLKKDKCNFGGIHRISKDGLATLENTPTDITQVKSFLGMLTYLRLLPNLATTLQPLHQLLKKGHVFRWGTDQERTFNMAKELLRKAPVLTHDVNKPFLLTCDASSYSVGAILAHQAEDNEQPVAFHSRTMATAETTLVEKEALSHRG